jgi:hypothetical protein
MEIETIQSLIYTYNPIFISNYIVLDGSDNA